MDRDKRWVLFCLVKLDRILKRMGIGNWELGTETNQPERGRTFFEREREIEGEKRGGYLI